MKAVARLCPGWLASQRDDLVQAAVMRVMKILEQQAHTGEGDQPLAASYLHKVAYSALVDEIRRTTRRRETDLEDAAVEHVAVTTQDPELVAASRQVGRGIQDCLSNPGLPVRIAARSPPRRHSVPPGPYGARETARVLEWPAKRADNLVYRGLADLRQCLLAKGMRP